MNNHRNLQVLQFTQRSMGNYSWEMQLISKSYWLWVALITITYLSLGIFVLKVKHIENISTINLYYYYLFLLLLSEWFFLYFKISLKDPVLSFNDLETPSILSKLLRDYVFDLKLFTFILPLPFFVYFASGTELLLAVIITINLIIYYSIVQLILVVALLFQIRFKKLSNYIHIVWPILIVTFSFGIIFNSQNYYNIFPPVFLSAHAISLWIDKNFLTAVFFMVISFLLFFCM